MATLRESYTATNVSFGVGLYGANWRAQTWLTAATYKITSVKISNSKDPGASGTLTVHIRPTSGGVPGGNGTDLITGTTPASSFADYPNPTIVEVTLGAGYNLTNATTYALIEDYQDVGIGGLNIFGKAPDDYANGDFYYDGNSGATWTGLSKTQYFEIWGEDIIVTNIKSINGLARASIKSVNGLAIASVKSFNGLA